MAEETKPKRKFKLITIGNSTTGKSSIIGRYTDGEFKTEIPSTIGVDFKYKDLNFQILTHQEDKFSHFALKYGLEKDLTKSKFLERASSFQKKSLHNLYTPQNIHLQLWDTAGQEVYRTVTRAYYRSSDAAIIVFDLSNRKSFESTSEWVKEINSALKNEILTERNRKEGKVRIYLVGNKADLEGEREVERGEAEALAAAIYRGEIGDEDSNDNNNNNNNNINKEEEKGKERIKNYYEISAKSGKGVNELFEDIARNLLLDEVFIERGNVSLKEQKGLRISGIVEEEIPRVALCSCGGGGDDDDEEEGEGDSEEEGSGSED